MAVAVEVPKLGNTVEECLITKWHKKPGDQVAANEPVADLETDKSNFEVAAPVAGTVLATFFDEGALVPIFANLFVIGEPGEDAEAFRPGGRVPASPTDQGAPAAAESPTTTSSAQPSAEPVENDAPNSAPWSPRARRFADEHRFHPTNVTGSGPGGRVLESDLRALYHSSSKPSGAAHQASDGKVPSGILGSGVGGMVLLGDLGQAESPTATKVSSLRDKIARRMRESLSSTAQYTLTTSADARQLLELRAAVKASPGKPNVNVGDLVAYCAVQAVLDVPGVNAHFADGRLTAFKDVHLGFACDTPRGLIVPVVHNAHAMSVAELAARMKALAAQAVAGTISPDDLRGGTFTISNLGAFGIESFTPLLNPPQVAILGVNAIQLKAVRMAGAIAFVDSIGFSLTLDHQIVDGAPGARFLVTLRDKIEHAGTICTI
jgi:pyruvate dehydrogenase E2 component (dihydrolipoamide acetyltransferase)